MADEAKAPTDGPNPEEVAAAPAEETLETLSGAEEIPAEEKEETVPLKKFMETKREGKEAKERAEALEQEIARLKNDLSSMSIPAVDNKLKELGEKHNVSPEFLAELMSVASTSLAPQIRQEMEKELNPKLSKIERERAIEARDRKFKELFTKTLKDNPEYEGIVNENVLRTLAFDPSNGKKTLPQILEEAYGDAIQGKRTIENGSGGGGRRDSGEVDLSNPSEADMEKINADPVLKKQWVEQTEEALRRYM